MALTKATSSFSQRTTTGQTSGISLASSYGHSLYLKHVNGSGTITVGAVVIVQVRTGTGLWANLTTYRFGLVASATETKVCPLPDDAGEVRLDYTVPTGSTGHTLDGDVGTVTALL